MQYKTKQILAIIIATGLFSCGDYQHRNYSLKIARSDYNYKTIHCDSFQMLDVNTAYIWVDRTKQKVYADYILPSNNEFKSMN